MGTKTGRTGRVRGLAGIAGAVGLPVLGLGVGSSGCLDRPIEPVEPRTTSVIVEKLTQSKVDKIDLLLAIDNSRSMADKQAILADAVPDLVAGLLNPPCRDKTAPNDPSKFQMGTAPTDECQEGFEREFEPVLDIHIGIISSSLGDYGGDVCPVDGSGNPTQDDKGHLLVRGGGGGDVATYNCVDGSGCGFLAWDPGEEKTQDKLPGGIKTLPEVQTALQDLVTGVGQVGCGFEAPLESWYRFLVDPAPYGEITIVDDQIVREGIDATVLKQRADFMRPDSLLAIIMLTDENDCSIISEEGTQGHIVALNNPFTMPAARGACAELGPNDPCCVSCAQNAPAECPFPNPADDPSCPQGKGTKLAVADDDVNLRCWDMKRRTGLDFLYPTERYVNALTQAQIDPSRVDLLGENTVPNPLFSNPKCVGPDGKALPPPNDKCLDGAPDDTAPIRDPGLVFLAGIVGVPWQDIARKDGPDGKSGAPSLTAGVNSLDPEAGPVGGFMTYDEMASLGVWDQILGDIVNDVDPTDPLMVETYEKRSGTNPATNEALTDTVGGNSINGNEYNIPGKDDLQYACIFELPTPTDCSAPGSICDCDGTADPSSPLCQPNPADGDEPTLQTHAKAYPGRRELAVLNGVLNQGIVASVCPAQLDDPTAGVRDYGYRPAVGAIIDRLKQALKGQCLPRTLTPDENTGLIPCIIVEARRTGQSGFNCESEPGRLNIAADHPAVLAAKDDPLAESQQWDTFCQIKQLEGDEAAVCQTQVDPDSVDGWCYVDATTVPTYPAQGFNPEVVADCPANEQRIIQFAGAGEVVPGGTLFITCAGST
jgi:hypothetical protein